ncbi:MAG: L,D-transpeptidase family protein [Thermoleophilia bacterium]
MSRAAILAIGGVLAAVLVFVVAMLVIDSSRSDTIADGVRIGSVDVGGMDREEAVSLVQRELGDSVGETVVATYEDREFTLSPDDAEAELDAAASVDAAIERSREGDPFSRVLSGSDASATVPPRVSYDESTVERFAERVADGIDRDARDGDIEWRDGKLDRTRARAGLDVQQDKLVAAVGDVIENPSAERELKIPVEVTERPDVTYEDLAKKYPTVIAIDRDAKRLRLYKNLELEHKYRIAVGKAGHETTAGRYEIQSKQVDPAWHAPDSDWAGELAGQTIAPGDPRNPLEARWMGFHDGQGIHGTSDIDSLGETASHGCIRMAVPDVEELYDKVEKGTPVFVQ